MSAEGPGLPGELEVLLRDEALRQWLVDQRWYASKSRTVSAIEPLESVRLSGELALVLAQARFTTGTHELYQLLLYGEPVPAPTGPDSPGTPTGPDSPGAAPAGQAVGDDPPAASPIAAVDGRGFFDVCSDPSRAHELLALMEAGAQYRTAGGVFAFHRAGVGGTASNLVARTPARVLDAEQSNSSIVFDERLILKLFRKLESGINPELEMLRFLTARGFANVAPLHGWMEYEGSSLAATLAIAQTFIADGRDGFELALEEIPTATERFLTRLLALGQVTAQMHNVLACDASDPAFSPEEPSHESLALLTATIDEEIERIFTRLPADDPRVAPILGRGQDVRERLAARSQLGTAGRQIRIHGDYHLGQTLHSPRGWVILDFEGEPARPLPERRAKRSPLRDVASMLRSFAYATSMVAQLHGPDVLPAEFEQRARERFLEGYYAAIDHALLPAGPGPRDNLLAVFELEKAIYELGYELDNRPDWIGIPVAGIARLLEEP
jgi:maltokinase